MRFVSIVGDSISTYEGFIPEGYELFYDRARQRRNGLSSVYDTWWAKVNQYFHAFICVNNSYSGSTVSGAGFPAASSPERISHLHSAMGAPDIILVYIGFNDFGYRVKIERDGIRRFLKKDVSYFQDAYQSMLERIKRNYPSARIICGTLMRTRIRYDKAWIFPENLSGIPFERYNAAIRKACRTCGCYLADLSKHTATYETLDGTHPTKQGHSEIANAWISCILLHQMLNPSIDDCIQRYHLNRSSGEALNRVFSSLRHERVLLPVGSNAQATVLRSGSMEFIPCFTSPDKTRRDIPMSLRPVFLHENRNLLISENKSLIINPYSEQSLQFIIPFARIDKILKKY